MCRYIGPYAEVRIKVVCEKRDRCKNPKDCPNLNPDPLAFRYCSVCGIELETRFWEMEKPISFYQLFGDVLTSDTPNDTPTNNMGFRTYCFFPNRHHLYTRRPDGIQRMDLTKIDTTIETLAFKSEYKEQLDKLRELGEVTVKWGYLSWIH